MQSNLFEHSFTVVFLLEILFIFQYNFTETNATSLEVSVLGLQQIRQCDNVLSSKQRFEQTGGFSYFANGNMDDVLF